MFTETRKINLIEAVLKESNETTLMELESVIKKSKPEPSKQRLSAHKFSGLLTKKDAALIEKAVEEGCEQIHKDDWK